MRKDKIWKNDHRFGILELLASIFLARHHNAQVNKFYRFLDELFNVVTEDSGILNFGYAESPASGSLIDAQKALVRLTAQTLPRGGKWLDVGCGTGGPACVLARENPNVTITGISITPAHIRRARARAVEAGLNSRLAFRVGDAMAMPFPDCAYEGVYAIETAFHYPDKHVFVKEAYRVLRPGGRFAVADIVLQSEKLNPLQALSIALAGRLFASAEFFTPCKWQVSLEKAGFSDVHVQDISRPTFSLLHYWSNKLKAYRVRLMDRYPAILLDLFQRGLIHCSQTPEKLPFRYVLVNAHKAPAE